MNGTMRRNLIDYLENFGFSTDAKEAFIRDFDKLSEHPRAIATLSAHVENYKSGSLEWESFDADAKLAADECGIHEYSANFLFYTALIPYSYRHFEEKGLGYTEWYDSMIDFRWKLDECIKVYGIYGVFTTWFKSFFTADRIAFGRLQFNLIKAERDLMGENISVSKGDTVIAVHIPSDTRTPFSKENRESAYKRAAKYFSSLLGTDAVIFRCGTWLLHPAHREILPESSNVRSFLDDFDMVMDSFTETDSNIWRLFYTKSYNGDPNTLPEGSSLMRAYKKFMLGGGKIGTMIGLRREEIK